MPESVQTRVDCLAWPTTSLHNQETETDNMLNTLKQRSKALTMLAALTLLILFAVAFASPVMGHGHAPSKKQDVPGCVKWDDDGNCIETEAPAGGSLQEGTGVTPSGNWPDPD